MKYIMILSDSKMSLTFETAKFMFMEFSQTFASEGDRCEFFQWLKEEVVPEYERSAGDSGKDLPTSASIERIAADIRARLPLEAFLPSEKIVAGHIVQGEYFLSSAEHKHSGYRLVSTRENIERQQWRGEEWCYQE